jgi:hypothetical protein
VTGEKFLANGQYTYPINDPAYGSTTLGRYNNYYYEGVTYLHLLSTPQYRPLSLVYRIHSPVHLVITDPSGHKSGFDPRTNMTWDEIPNASYTIESITSPDGNSNPEIKELFIPNPETGLYSVQVIGYDSGS